MDILYNFSSKKIPENSPYTLYTIEYYTHYYPLAFPSTHSILQSPEDMYSLYQFAIDYQFIALKDTLELAQFIYWFKKIVNTIMDPSSSFQPSTTLQTFPEEMYELD